MGGIQVENIKAHLMKDPNVCSVHHLHICPISTTENAMTVHVVLEDMQKLEETKKPAYRTGRTWY